MTAIVLFCLGTNCIHLGPIVLTRASHGIICTLSSYNFYWKKKAEINEVIFAVEIYSAKCVEVIWLKAVGMVQNISPQFSSFNSNSKNSMISSKIRQLLQKNWGEIANFIGKFELLSSMYERLSNHRLWVSHFSENAPAVWKYKTIITFCIELELTLILKISFQVFWNWPRFHIHKWLWERWVLKPTMFLLP